MSEHIIMKNQPVSERPYEKFQKYGIKSLSDAELLGIILKTGTGDQTCVDLAKAVLSGKHGNLLNLYEKSVEELCMIPGIGRVKAIQIKVIAELSERIARTNRGYHIIMQHPKSIADYYMEQMRHLAKEILVCAFFDAKTNFIGDVQLSQGSTNYAYISPKDIFEAALTHRASVFVLLHNHPSGDPTPSRDDIRVTERIRKCADFMDIQFADHIIIGDNSYFSFLENEM